MSDDDQTVHLINAWNGGDHDALGRLLEDNLDWMRHYVRRELDDRMRKRLDSVDIVQNGIARLLKRGPRYAPRCREEFRALLAKVLQGALGDGRDHERAAKRDVGREQGLPSQGLSRFAPGNEIGRRPESTLMRRERDERLNEALDKLAPDDAAVLRLRHLEELEFGEIAERLGLASADAARMRYHRSLPRLTRAMEGTDEEG